MDISDNFGLPMQRLLLLLLGASCGLLSQAQYPARLVFNNAAATMANHPWVVFNPDNNTGTNPGTYLVIDNSNANAITQLGVTTAPVIKSETEFNKIRWATGAATGAYVIPFSTTSGVAMPLTLNKTTAGSGAGSIIFSTYNSLGKAPGSPVASGWNNYLYRPSDVTHMNDQLTGLVNNSKNAVDRFWIIDAGEGSYAYGTKPAVTITFAFDPVETQANGGNDAGLVNTANNLVAQRFNPAPVNFWYDVLPMGSQSSTTEVSGVNPAPASFFRSWTLSNKMQPLPITLVAWDGQCEDKVVKLTWTTASEQDNHHFTIEKSRDANDWADIGTVPGAGNSSSMISYSFTDDGAQGLAYYRLRQTDINGTTTVSNTIAAGCGADNGIAIVNAWDDGDYLNLVVSSTLDAVYDLTLMDAQGKVMTTRSSQVINTGSTTLRVDKRGISTGIYMVQLLNSTNVMSRRVHLD